MTVFLVLLKLCKTWYTIWYLVFNIQIAGPTAFIFQIFLILIVFDIWWFLKTKYNLEFEFAILKVFVTLWSEGRRPYRRPSRRPFRRPSRRPSKISSRRPHPPHPKHISVNNVGRNISSQPFLTLQHNVYSVQCAVYLVQCTVYSVGCI